MLEAFSTPRNRIWTFILLAFCGVLAIAAGVIGISDNPPGIALAFLSAGTLILAFVHPWRTSKQFLYLLLASVLALVVFAVLHNVFEGVAREPGNSGLFYWLLGGAGVAFFLLAVLVCPMGLLVGSVGALVMSIRNRRRPSPGPTTAA